DREKDILVIALRSITKFKVISCEPALKYQGLTCDQVIKFELRMCKSMQQIFRLLYMNLVE
ncbi:MAG: hypothetical protein Q8L68_01970, partial [Methylococcales bacterium]|nr:hypothetical protein [Methylococcales bacterium]